MASLLRPTINIDNPICVGEKVPMELQTWKCKVTIGKINPLCYYWEKIANKSHCGSMECKLHQFNTMLTLHCGLIVGFMLNKSILVDHIYLI